MLIIGKRGNNPKYPAIYEQINKMQYVVAMKYYFGNKKE